MGGRREGVVLAAESLIYAPSARRLPPGRCFIRNQPPRGGGVLMEKHVAAAAPRQRPHLHTWAGGGERGSKE